MPRKKTSVKVGAPAVRIRENSRLMQTNESTVDYLSGRSPMGSLLDVFAPSVFMQTFNHLESSGYNFCHPTEDDLSIYSDEDDDDVYEDCFPRGATHSPLAPHPQIKELTDEEANKLQKELVEDEERRKDKSERNKRKKMRKKEKKRLEKENEVKDVLPEEEDAQPDPVEIPKESPLIENIPHVNVAAAGDQSQNSTPTTEGDEDDDNSEEENVMKMSVKEKEVKKDSFLQNFVDSAAESVKDEATCEETPQKERLKEKVKLAEVKQAEELKSDAAEKIQNKKQEKVEVIKEQTLDPTAEDLAKRSLEFASMGNRLAAAGQFEMAVQLFTDAIKFNPTEFKLFGNRSLCFERLQQYENALLDADVALAMEPNWIKGLFRKGKALCGLKRYYEASLIYSKVLSLERTSDEAAKELKRAQTLHLMEMGFSWGQSAEALKAHSTLEEAVDALFVSERNGVPKDAASLILEQEVVQEETMDDDDDGGWTVLQSNRPRTQHVRDAAASRPNSQLPTHRFRNSTKPELFPVWVGTLSDSMTYARLHELFSRVGTIYSIKMLLEHQCAFVNFVRPEDCDRAIQCIHGMVVDGAPLTVRYPFKIHPEMGASHLAATDPNSYGSFAKKECFFWRTTGCTRADCTFRHIPEHKNMDRDKFTSRLGFGANHK